MSGKQEYSVACCRSLSLPLQFFLCTLSLCLTGPIFEILLRVLSHSPFFSHSKKIREKTSLRSLFVSQFCTHSVWCCFSVILHGIFTCILHWKTEWTERHIQSTTEYSLSLSKPPKRHNLSGVSSGWLARALIGRKRISNTRMENIHRNWLQETNGNIK